MQSGIFIDVPLFLMSSDVYHAAIVLIITMIKTTMYAIASASIISFNILTILLLPAFLFLMIENTRSAATIIPNISAKKSIIIFLLLQLTLLPFLLVTY